jgi:hypothetical protein
MNSVKTITLVLLFGLATGCAKNVGSTYDPLAIFPAQATWSWDPTEIIIPSDERLDTLNINEIVRESIVEGFAERGYTEAPIGSKAPYLLAYEIGIGRTITRTRATAIGSLSVSLVESNSNRRVWVGFIRLDVDTSRTEAERRDLLRREVRNMLRSFPPSQRR